MCSVASVCAYQQDSLFDTSAGINVISVERKNILLSDLVTLEKFGFGWTLNL